MRKGVIIASAILTALGIAYLLYSFRYDIGTMGRPGPGVYPLFVGSIFVLTAAGTLVSTIINPPEGTISWPVGSERARVLIIIATGFFYAFMLEILGYLICGAIALFVFLHVMGTRSWLMKIGITLAVTVVFFFVFDQLLNVPLPRGPFQFIR